MLNYGCTYYFSKHKGIADQVNDLILQASECSDIVKLVFFGLIDQEEYVSVLELINKLAAQKHLVNYPLISLISQKVLGENLMGVEVHYIPGINEKLCSQYRQHENIRYLVFQTDNQCYLLTEGVRSVNTEDSVQAQSDCIFSRIEKLLKKENFEVNDIIRQWNYIGSITDFTGEIQNYQAFNDSRSLCYAKCDWIDNGYPAATGIGMEGKNVIVDLIAGKTLSKQKMIYPIDNPKQVAAHSYSTDVLSGKEDERLDKVSTPKFERAKVVCPEGNRYTCFISGTAAIHGEISLETLDIAHQLSLTVRNINYLISEVNLKNQGFQPSQKPTIISLRVYLKHPADYEIVRNLLLAEWPAIPTLFLEADVCRDELLIEIEGIAGDRADGI